MQWSPLLFTAAALVQGARGFRRSLPLSSLRQVHLPGGGSALRLLPVNAEDDPEDRAKRTIDYLEQVRAANGSASAAGERIAAPLDVPGEGSIFEKLVEFPCEFQIKIIGLRERDFHLEMVDIVAGVTGVEAAAIRFSVLDKGKYQSVSVHAPVTNADMLYKVYEEVSKDERVKFKI